ncbi:23S rRNA (guanosine(2251)-2'-O)-methyltransferase RlmB [Plasticicumulans sp.]|uniref:23S rRNA (guanosine(2251)-2'-O)-methyltransferase RlmB n=1 Tax=Plasticicumulans sp. TaxID=2307179 RepID=UPI002C2DB898|nr:23S rRNA (guanosine(2251)-2'-O)-methyltransferase RlmB [Plasticicumulans sp.]MBS0600438.1 23S rRNA (guanosine(2251)-2'-O)-methyltransferase RlmB [Pseudomonadota bacterium]HMW41934.1 23S rRNA (guanosine(2251)-2'-O)-methyltransferase RlmB [Plasticicumulans sp.]HNE02634.1 23S rRNA (guanosine(2251)-2'-O)-methyltransferase RlmB [Plasticicumulans sp.]HNI22926.1 23S rRNA (guanosine(2251)-2'-O)-methyltransferase RlmB [Plasticicumulans sp.]HNM44197.1 23S rRNA (guanosine(2251)-2'-O)-methyltransferase
MSEELIYGLHAVGAALRHEPQRLRGLWVDRRRRDARIRELLALAEAAGVRVYAEDAEALDRQCGGERHQGVFARMKVAERQWREDELDALLDAIEGPALLLVLDGVQDPHNLGACLRSADAAGVHAVLAPNDRAAGLTPTARKVACGAAEHVPFIPVTNLARTLRELKQRGIWLVGAAGEAEADLYAMDLAGPVALVLGAEEKGLRRLTREECDYLAHIPMTGTVESLNVSVATGVFLFEALRQRRARR